MSETSERLSAIEDRLTLMVAYDPASGLLTWKSKPNRNIVVGRAIGRPNSWGHFTFGVMGRTLMVHRVAWFLTYGKWPDGQIDHIDGDKSNNRLLNLRDVSQAINMQNQTRGHRGTRSGLLGAHDKRSSGGQWESSIKVNGKKLYLSSFLTAEAAHTAYLAAKRQLHEGNTL